MTTTTLTPQVSALYRIASTLDGRQMVAISLGMCDDRQAKRLALFALAGALPDLGRHADAVDTILEAYTPGRTRGDRARHWDLLTEAVARLSTLTGEGPDAVSLLLEELPPGTSAHATWLAEIDASERQAVAALDVLTAPAAPVWAAA